MKSESGNLTSELLKVFRERLSAVRKAVGNEISEYAIEDSTHVLIS